MPLFLDTYNLPGITEEGVTNACRKIYEVEDKYDVSLLHTWFDLSTGKVLCLYYSPDAQASDQTRREAHGMVPDETLQVQECKVTAPAKVTVSA
jgi:hypothetical protein